jgi:polysaccharide export outer membrane protein
MFSLGNGAGGEGLGRFKGASMREGVSSFYSKVIILTLLVVSPITAQDVKKENEKPKEVSSGSSAPLNEKGGAIQPAPALGSGPAAPVDPKTYVIGAGDVLAIQVWKEPEFTRAVQVRPDGKFSMPLIGEVVGAGLTPEQLSGSLAEKLSSLLLKPEVMVGLQQVESKKFYISGEVNKPGAYALVMPVTVLEALINAGGLREYANQKNIIIMRGKDRLKFNFNEVIKGKKMEQNIALQSGDYIIVK